MLLSIALLGQNAKAIYTDRPIEIDGIIEDTWEKAPESSPFWEYFPTDTLRAKEQTQVKILFDESYLYVLINAESEDKNFISSSLRRDFSSRNNDSVTLVLDTFNDGTTAFLFGTNPEGVRREALISNGGNNFPRDFNRSWDVKWQAEVKKTDWGYVTEMKIPLSSLRYPDNATQWRVNVYRSEIGANRQSSWANIPRNQIIAGLAYMKTLDFEKAYPKPKSHLLSFRLLVE